MPSFVGDSSVRSFSSMRSDRLTAVRRLLGDCFLSNRCLDRQKHQYDGGGGTACVPRKPFFWNILRARVSVIPSDDDDGLVIQLFCAVSETVES